MQMEKRTLRKLQVLTLLVALLLIAPSAYSFLKGFAIGFNTEGVLQASHRFNQTSFLVSIKPVETDIVDMESAQHENVSVIELGKETILSIPEAKMSASLDIASNILSVIALISFIAMLVMLFKISTSVWHIGLMNRRNIRRLRQLSFYMLLLDFSGLLNNYLPVNSLKAFIPAGYTLDIAIPTEHITIAIIILLLAEILNIANKLREEQEFTI